jgi:hypothetical protein
MDVMTAPMTFIVRTSKVFFKAKNERKKGVVHLCGSNLPLVDTNVADGVHLPFTYNALRGLLLPYSFRSGYSISVLFLGNVSVPQKTTEIWMSGVVWGDEAKSWCHQGALYQHLLLVQSPY